MPKDRQDYIRIFYDKFLDYVNEKQPELYLRRIIPITVSLLQLAVFESEETEYEFKGVKVPRSEWVTRRQLNELFGVPPYMILITLKKLLRGKYGNEFEERRKEAREEVRTLYKKKGEHLKFYS